MLLSQLKAMQEKIKPILFLVLLALLRSCAYTYQRLQHDFETLDGTAYLWQDLEGKWVVVITLRHGVHHVYEKCLSSSHLISRYLTIPVFLLLTTTLKRSLNSKPAKFDIELAVIVSSRH